MQRSCGLETREGEKNMKNKLLLGVMLGMVLAFGMTVVGCKDDKDDEVCQGGSEGACSNYTASSNDDKQYCGKSTCAVAGAQTLEASGTLVPCDCD
jgi:hypothetical protein